MTDKPQRENWREWVPDASEPRLITRGQVLDYLARLKTQPPVTANDLRYWEGLGVLPQPIRRRHEGATRALYPLWYVPLVRQLRLFQLAGFTLDALPERMRAQARLLSERPGRAPSENEAPVPDKLRELDELLDLLLWPEWPRGYPFTTPTIGDKTARALLAPLWLEAHVQRTIYGIPITRAEIHLKDDHGHRVPLPEIPLPQELPPLREDDHPGVGVMPASEPSPASASDDHPLDSPVE